MGHMYRDDVGLCWDVEGSVIYKAIYRAYGRRENPLEQQAET